MASNVCQALQPSAIVRLALLSGGRQGVPRAEHLSPVYAAGYDAGFQAGLLAASQGGAPPPGRGVIDNNVSSAERGMTDFQGGLS